MPGTTTPPADGTTGDEGKTTTGQGAQGGTSQGQGAPTGDGAPMLTLTQAQLDAIIEERALRETRSKFADYETLKQKAAQFDQAEEANKTELQKAVDRAEKAEEAAKAANARADATLRRAAIMAEAASQNAADADTVVALLAAVDSIIIEGDGITVKGAKEAVAKLLKDKPFLVKAEGPKTPGNSGGGEFGGNDGKTTAEKIREAEAKGDHKTALSLKTRGLIPGS